jgi:hypothetical protein
LVIVIEVRDPGLEAAQLEPFTVERRTLGKATGIFQCHRDIPELAGPDVWLGMDLGHFDGRFPVAVMKEIK